VARLDLGGQRLSPTALLPNQHARRAPDAAESIRSGGHPVPAPGNFAHHDRRGRTVLAALAGLTVVAAFAGLTWLGLRATRRERDARLHLREADRTSEERTAGAP